MTDYFAFLNEPRRPWLDPDSLKGKFLELSAEIHPDRVHDAPEAEKQRAHTRYLELNAAYNCLKEPKSRLRHLLELEGTSLHGIEQMPSGSMELVLETGQLCRAVDSFLAERARVTSPLLKVEMFEVAHGWTDKLNAAQRTLNERQEEIAAELRQMNHAWEAAPVDDSARASSLPLARLDRVYRDVSYCWRCVSQIQERIAQLSF